MFSQERRLLHLPHAHLDESLAAQYPPPTVSFAQVLEELPILTQPQRRELALRLFALETTDQEAADVAGCEHAAALGFAMLDEMEAEDRTQLQCEAGA